MHDVRGVEIPHVSECLPLHGYPYHLEGDPVLSGPASHSMIAWVSEFDLIIVDHSQRLVYDLIDDRVDDADDAS